MRKKIFFIIITVFLILMFLILISTSFLYLTRKNKYSNFISTVSDELNLDKNLVKSIIYVESKWVSDAVSNKGAIGLMQILPSTAEYMNNFYNLNIDNINLKDYETNILIGCYYLKYLKTKFLDDYLVIASYNAGETVVRSWLKNESYSKDGKKLDNIPYKETKNYLKKVIFNKNLYKLLY